MKEQHNPGMHEKTSNHDYTLLWLSVFAMILPTIAIIRLLPTQWKHWSSGENLFTVLRDAKAHASIVTTMAYKAY